MTKLFVGADLGGTNFRVGVRLAGACELAADEAEPAQGAWTAPTLIARLQALLDRMLARLDLGAASIAGIGFGITGDIDFRTGTCSSMKRFPALEGMGLKEHLERRFLTPAHVLNDGLTAALAELRAGSGRDTRDFVLVTLGTGIGGGVVMDGALLLGERGRIGKVGHQIIDLDGPIHCHCGLPGCWQSLAGKEGVVERARRVSRRYPGSLLATAVGAPGGFELPTLTELAEVGDEASREVLEETGRCVGIGLANLVKIFAPQRLIVGGGLAAADLLLEAAQRTVARYAIKPYQDVPIVPAAFRTSAGLVGATFLAEGL